MSCILRKQKVEVVSSYLKKEVNWYESDFFDFYHRSFNHPAIIINKTHKEFWEHGCFKGKV